MEGEPRPEILEQLRATEERARAMLTDLLHATRIGDAAEVTRELLKPRDEDYARVFATEVVAPMKRGYRSLWQGDVGIEPHPAQSELLVIAAFPSDLLIQSGRGRRFPGGYADIARFLRVEHIWVRFKFVKPGESLGMAYDGLVWLDDHWAWFPKPWKALSAGGEE